MTNNKSSMEARIAARYNDNLAVAKRKNVTFNIDEELLERLDTVVAHLGGNTTRNAVIEDSILEYIEVAEDFLESQSCREDTYDTKPYDTAIFPALNTNFGRVFIGEHKWYHVRIAAHRVENIKYIALYRGAPVSAITHYAEVESISEPNSDNKRIINVKEPVPFTHPIILGDIHVNSVRKLFYTSLDSLKSVNTVKELIEKRF